MTMLISPANRRPCEFVAARDGFVCLRQNYVTPQVRWFTLTAIERLNPVYTCAEPPKPYKVMGKDMWIDDTAEDFLGESALAKLRAEPPKALTVVLTPDMARNINHAVGVRIVSLENNISLYHDSMVDDAAA